MKVTIDIPDTIIYGFLNVVCCEVSGYSLVSFQLGSDDLKDGNTVKLPR